MKVPKLDELEWLRVAHAARLLKVTPAAVADRARRGTIRSRKVGRARFVHVSDLVRDQAVRS